MSDRKEDNSLKESFLQIAFIATLLVTWEIWGRVQNQTLVPTPTQCILALIELASNGTLANDSLASLYRVVCGFAMAAAIGVGSGLALGTNSSLRNFANPIVEFLRPIPPIAWIPISMTLFGLGDMSAEFVIFIGAFFPIFTNTLLGVREIPTVYLDAASLLGATKERIYRQIIWPAALPSIFAGLKVGIGFAWMCVVAAEMIAAHSGLGYEIQLNRQILRLDRVVAGMITIGALGLIMNQLMLMLERLVIPWRQAIDKEPQHQLKVQETSEDDRSFATRDLESLSLNHNTTGATFKFNHMSYGYSQNTHIVNDINIDITPGQVFCILGSSGCGKTTLLRLSCGLLSPTSGKILLDDKPLAGIDKKITMIFQNAALFPWMSCEENISFALESAEPIASARAAKARQYLNLVGLVDKRSSFPSKLSGGQQQRVGLARALAYDPEVLLMDEPFASLDSQTRELLQEEVSKVIAARQLTVILVTHDIREAIFMSDRIAIMSKKDGKLLNDWSVLEKRPRDADFRYTHEFSQLRAKLWDQMHEREPVPQ